MNSPNRSNSARSFPAAKSSGVSKQSDAHQPGITPPRLRGRRVLLGAALLVFIASTIIAFTQSPTPDPYDYDRSILSVDWWRYPVERNAPARLMSGLAYTTAVCAVPNSDHVWAVGLAGLVLHSTDAGETWQQIPWQPSQSTVAAPKKAAAPTTQLGSPTDQKPYVETPAATAPASQPTRPQYALLSQVTFVDEDHGWITSSANEISRTGDGGRTWTLLPPLAYEGRVQFVSPKRGWVLTSNDHLQARTDDGGNTWAEIRVPELCNEIRFLNESTGFAVGDGGLFFHTSDGGDSWVAGKSPPRIVPKSASRPTVPAEEATEPDFSCVYPMSAASVWAATNDGRAYHTADGGETWSPPVDVAEDTLGQITFDSSGVAWILGEKGFYISRDAGRTWVKAVAETYLQTIDSLPQNWIAVLQHGVAIIPGMQGLRKTTDFGRTWRLVSAPLLDVTFVDAQHGWAHRKNLADQVLVTRNAGASWHAVVIKELGDDFISKFFFLDAHHGWLITDSGVPWATADGGETWEKRGLPGKGIQSLFFFDERRGWMVSSDNIATTNDGGWTWRIPQGSLSGGSKGLEWTRGVRPDFVRFVDFADAAHGIAVGSGVWVTATGGESWNLILPSAEGPFGAAQMVDAATAYVSKSDGSILGSSDGGQTWAVRRNADSMFFAAPIPPMGMAWVGPHDGWAASVDGGFLITKDGGSSWTSRRAGEGSNDAFVYLKRFDADNAVMATINGAVYHTSDAGRSWTAPESYRKWPAPWYYLTWLLVLGLLVPGLRPPKPYVATESIANQGYSDNPTKLGEPDPLQFAPTARGLSRFLRNENTPPPLTIAVTGEWGSGKSSLMGMLKSDLESYGFRPVWFNAWHHQKEEHLLAALLENVRAQAIPPWWSREGLPFRARLLAQRSPRYAVMGIVLLAALAISVGYLTRNGGTSAVQEIAAMFEKKPQTQSSATPPAHETGFLAELSEWATAQHFAWATAILSISTLLAGLYKQLKGFGANPAELLAKASGDARIRDLGAQNSFRFRFAAEFADVTKALTPLSMLILIDDLDRCRPEYVLDLFEAINFLVTSGDCYVVMGMDRDKVERAIGVGFKAVSDDLLGGPAAAPGAAGQASAEEAARQRRVEYARRYLEKLLNLEVPVPQASPRQLGQLMGASLETPAGKKTGADDANAPAPWRGRLWSSLQVAKQIVSSKALWALAGIAFLFWLGHTILPTPSPRPSPTIASSAATQPATKPATTQPVAAAPGERDQSSGDFLPLEAKLIPPQRSPSHPLLLLLLAIPVGVLCVWVLGQRPEAVVGDSRNFLEALGIWQEFIATERKTPRSVKRFMNRLRYYAMCQQAESPPASSADNWQLRLRRFLGAPQPPAAPMADERNTAGPDPIPETALVALAAIHYFRPAWFQDDHAWSKLKDNDFTTLPDATELIAAKLAEATEQHRRKFSQQPFDDKYRAALIRLYPSIHVF